MKRAIIMGLVLGLVCGVPEVQASRRMVERRSPQTTGEFLVTDSPTIKVLLAQNVASALLEAKGAFRVYKMQNGAPISYGSTGKRYVVHPLPDGLRWGEVFPDVFQIVIVPEEPNGMVYVDGHQYRGAIHISQNRNRITIVNEVDVEDFLKSTLTKEVPEGIAKEALAALAITARTQAYFRVATAAERAAWHVTAQETNYLGYGVTKKVPAMEEAVEGTRLIALEQKDVKKAMAETVMPFEVSWGEGCAGSKDMLDLRKAAEMAERGMDATRILHAFFPEAKVVSAAVTPQQPSSPGRLGKRRS